MERTDLACFVAAVTHIMMAGVSEAAVSDAFVSAKTVNLYVGRLHTNSQQAHGAVDRQR